MMAAHLLVRSSLLASAHRQGQHSIERSHRGFTYIAGNSWYRAKSRKLLGRTFMVITQSHPAARRYGLKRGVVIGVKY